VKLKGIDNEGNVVNHGDAVDGLPAANNLVNVRGQYRKATSTDAAADEITIEDSYLFEGSGYISSPYYTATSHGTARGKSIVGVHKTKFLEELKAGYQIKPYNKDTYTVQSVQHDTQLTTTTPITSAFQDIEFQIGNFKLDGTISFPDTSKTSLHGSWAPSSSKFTTQLKGGYTISTGSPEHSDSNAPAQVASVVHDQLVILSSKFIATFENEPLWVVLGPRGTGLVTASASSSRITGSNPCAAGHPCHPETKFLSELRVGDRIEIDDTLHNSYPFTRVVAAIEDDAHLELTSCLAVTNAAGQDSNGSPYTNGAGVECVGMDAEPGMDTNAAAATAAEDAGSRNLKTTSKFKIRSFHNQPYTYAKNAAGAVDHAYIGDARQGVPVTVDQTTMGGGTVSLTHTIGRDYAIIVQVTVANQAPYSTNRPGPPVYERRMVKRISKKNEVVVDSKFSRSFVNSGGATGASTMFWYEPCPSLTYENFDDRVENGPGVISGQGASYTYDNTQYAMITSSTADFEINVRVGYEILLRSTGVKRRVTKIVSNTLIHVNRPFYDMVNDAPSGFSDHAWQYVVKKGSDKNILVVNNDAYHGKHAYGSDYHLHAKYRYATGGANSRQQGAVSNPRQVFSHQMKSSTTSSGAGILSQDPYLLYPPVCYNNGRCVPKTSHSHVGIENIIKQPGTNTDRLGQIFSSSAANPVHDLINVGDTTLFHSADCKPVCTVTACKDNVCETRQAVATTTAHNSTHMYTSLPFTYNETGVRSQYNNEDVPGFVPAGTTAYNAMAEVQFRVRYVTATGTVHWCPNANAGAGAPANNVEYDGGICDPYTLTGASKETKTKFSSETSTQWSLTIPCTSTGENRTISQVHSDTKIVVHDSFTTSQNKVCYHIGNIPGMGRVTAPQGKNKVTGNADTRFLEQLKVNQYIKVGNLERRITSISSNSELTVNTAFTGGVNTYSAFSFHGKLGTGEVSISAGSTDVIGTLDVTQTKFNEELDLGYLVFLGNTYRVVTGISTATKLTVDLPFEYQVHTSGQRYGFFKNSYNYESCYTYEIGDFADEDDYTNKHVYVEDACEIKPGCCGFKISSTVWPDKWAYYKIRPLHSNMNIRVVATTTEDNIDLVAKKDAVPTTSSFHYNSVRESNPWALTIPGTDITCGESYVGYNINATLGTQAHITNPSSLVDDTSTFDADAVSFGTDTSFHPSNCSFFYIGVRGDNRYPQKTGASEYNLLVYTEFEFPNFICADAVTDTTAADGKHACRYLGLSAVEDAAFVLNTDDDRAVMRLTPNTNMRKGALWYSTKLHLFDGFETIFEFRMSYFTVGCNSVSHPSGFCGGGDGFAFLIHDKIDGDKDIGCYGSALGYGTITAADQGDNWARPRCLTFDANSNAAKCDSGCASDSDALDTTCASTATGNLKHQDDGVFGEQCVLGALCDPLDNGCGGTCGMPSCTQAIGRVVAVEFDTWNNLGLHDPKQGVSRWWINATEFIGYNDNHVAIFSSDSSYGTSTDHASPNHFAATPSIPNLADGKNHTVKIKYWPQKSEAKLKHVRTLKKNRGQAHSVAITANGDCYDNTGATNMANRREAPDQCFPGAFTNLGYGNLAVFIDDMKRPVLQTKIALRKGNAAGDADGVCFDTDYDRCVLDVQGNAYIGFSASTGGERVGVTMDQYGVTDTFHQQANIDAVEALIAEGSGGTGTSNSAVEATSLQTGAAQTHEIISWKFCNTIGCVAA
jgi:hypothetical protein